MCSINHDLKLIFIHTPKCGGLFVEKILDRFYGFNTYYFTHENHNLFVDNENNDENEKIHGFLRITKQGVLRYFMTSDIHNKKTDMTLDKWKSYTKFAIKRNPYDRFISACKYINVSNYKNSIDKRRISKKLIVDKSLINTDIKNINNYNYFHLYISQYDHLIDSNNEFKIDYMINFENLNNELCYFLLNNGVNKIQHRQILLNNFKLNTSSINENYTKYYNQEIINFVNDIFTKDFEKFEYIKVSTIEELIIQSKKYFISDEQFEKNNIKLLIELDNKNQIISFNDSHYSELVIKNSLQKSNDIEINSNIITDNEIILPNGIKLNTKQEKKPEKKIIDKNFH